MRILGYIEHPQLKITVFKMDTRLSVKFEDERAEQTFKFRMQEGLSGLTDVQKLIDERFIAEVLRRFAQMHRQSSLALQAFIPPPQPDVFENII